MYTRNFKTARMKKLITLFVVVMLPLLMVAQGVTVQLSGSVTSINTNQGVANHPVTIMTDSITGGGVFYYNTVYTDVNGNFTDYILLPPNTQIPFMVYTFDCQNAIQVATVFYAGGMIPFVNFQICTTQPLCSAAFMAVPDSSNPGSGYGMAFYDMSLGNPVSWIWDFGDGTSGTGSAPYHTYAQAGMYQVCLTIANANGCTDQSCQNVLVGNVFPQCQAAYTWTADSNALNSISFWDLSLGNINAWYWTFGDGTTSTAQNPSHTYSQNGVYNVCLTVAGANNCTSTFCDSVWVGNNPMPCQNYFSYGAQGLIVAFYGYAFGGTAPYTYTWDFGDGSTATTAYATHIYQAGGTYTVMLTTTDATGCAYTTTQVVFVSSVNPSWINGQVFANGQYADYGWVYLYGLGNPGTNLLSLLDSAYIDSSGFYYFNNVPNGTYYLLAELMPGSMYYGQYMPTYYTSSIFWAGATPINLGQPSNPYNINLVPVIGPNAGPGNINGTITTGNKFTASGVPVPNVEIILLDMSNQPLAMTYSNAAGQFGFASLAFGTYKIYAEVPGLGCVPAMITLSQAIPAVSNVGMTVTPNGITTAIDEPKETGIDRMYPNPAKEKLTLELYAAKSEEITILMVDILGNKVLKQVAQLSSGKTRIDLNTSDLNPGSYTLQTIHASGEKLVRKVNIIR